MHELLVAVNVTHEAGYQQYRDSMAPILTDYGGDFGYDFRVNEVLRAETDAPINRVFTIHFPNRVLADAFFTNADYLKIRDTYFEPSVSDLTIIARYDRT